MALFAELDAWTFRRSHVDKVVLLPGIRPLANLFSWFFVHERFSHHVRTIGDTCWVLSTKSRFVLSGSSTDIDRCHARIPMKLKGRCKQLQEARNTVALP